MKKEIRVSWKDKGERKEGVFLPRPAGSLINKAFQQALEAAGSLRLGRRMRSYGRNI